MAGTNTITYEEISTVKVIKMDWLCDASGAVNGTVSTPINGIIERVLFISDTGGTAPTNLWDCTVEDADGEDVLAGLGANIAIASTPESKVPVLGTYFKVAVSSTLELKVTNAGNAKGGEVHIYYR